MNIKILTIGSLHGRLKIVGNPIKTLNNPLHYECQCTCGNIKIFNGAKLRSGHTTSCGCLRQDTLRKMSTTHGLSKTPIYKVRRSMLARCNNPTVSCFNLYGGRGIKVCKEWTEYFEPFYDWAIKTGYRKGLQIDRIDNDGNYSPENCRWASPRQNCRNTRHNRVFEFRGETKCLKEWCEFFGSNYKLVHARIQSGWPFEKAMFHKKMKSRFG